MVKQGHKVNVVAVHVQMSQGSAEFSKFIPKSSINERKSEGFIIGFNSYLKIRTLSSKTYLN